MKLIVGLGNPGIEYQFTPHNLGFLAIDRMASGLGVEVRNRQCRALDGAGSNAGLRWRRRGCVAGEARDVHEFEWRLGAGVDRGV